MRWGPVFGPGLSRMRTSFRTWHCWTFSDLLACRCRREVRPVLAAQSLRLPLAQPLPEWPESSEPEPDEPWSSEPEPDDPEPEEPDPE